MKKPVQKLGKLTILFLSIFLIAAACSKDDTPETKNPPSPTDNPDGTVQDSLPESTETLSVDPNKVTKSLKFRNARIINGDLPTGKSAKTTMVDLKIDTDTIFWVAGVTNRIKFLKPEGLTGFVGTFWAQVEGSDSYIEAEFEKEQENDTIVFLNFDFDVTEWDPPFSFNLKFVPSDDTGTEPIDVIEKPVVIEKKGACNFDLFESKAVWFWDGTYENGDYHTGPYDFSFSEGDVVGCCTKGESVYGPWCLPESDDEVILPYKSSYIVTRDRFTFLNNKEISGRLQENAFNIDIENTDFCSRSVAYSDSKVLNVFFADYKLDESNCSFTLENMSGQSIDVLGIPFPLPIYMGSGPIVEYKILSRHFIEEIRGNVEGGDVGSLVRIYEKAYVTVVAEGGAWFD